MPARSFPKQLHKAIRGWWAENTRQGGTFRAGRLLIHEMWEFLRDSTPERRRRRYGDVEFDWEHRVNTSEGTIGWRERLLGVFLSAYQPTDPAAFKEMMGSLPIDFREFTFIDLGSGKGRTLLMASEYPFRRIVGVEIVPELHWAAEENIRNYHSPTQRCRQIESICSDAREVSLPEEPTVLYLFNPLPLEGLKEVLANLEQSLGRSPRTAYVLYHNPLLEEHLRDRPWLKLLSRADQFVVYRGAAG